MSRPGLIGERAIVLFALAFIAFTPPILGIFNIDGSLFGVPILFAYLLCAWALVVLLVALQAHGAARESDRDELQDIDRDRDIRQPGPRR